MDYVYSGERLLQIRTAGLDCLDLVEKKCAIAAYVVMFDAARLKRRNASSALELAPVGTADEDGLNLR